MIYLHRYVQRVLKDGRELTEYNPADRSHIYRQNQNHTVKYIMQFIPELFQITDIAIYFS